MAITPKQLCQIELYAKDLPSSLVFLDKVLGWKAVSISLQDMVVIEVPDDCPFGISLVAKEEAALNPGCVPYFEIEGSMEELVNQGLDHGARLFEGPRLIPGYGQAVVLEEPGGLRLGFYLSKPS